MTTTSNTTNLLQEGTYKVDTAHSVVGFVARHLIGTKVRGHFSDFEASFTVANPIEDSSVEAVLQVVSVDTGNSMRDDHLRTNDFFDAATYPTMTLKSTGLSRVSDSEWKLDADLTVRGVTKPVTFDLEFFGEGPSMAEGKSVVGFSATGEIDRRDFGVSFNHSLVDGSVVVGNKIKIELEVEASLAE